MIHISKREGLPLWKEILVRVLAILLAVTLGVLLSVVFTGQSPLSIAKEMWSGSFGSQRRIWQLVQRTMMLTLIAVGLAPAFKMRFWNIGGEGQILIGGLGALILMKFAYPLPNVVLLVLMALTAAAFGAVWGMIPGFFKAKWNTNETLFTLMMNYIAIKLVLFFCTIWEGTKGTVKIGVVNNNKAIEAAYHKGWIPELLTGNFNNKDYWWLVILVLIVVFRMWVYLNQTKHGYEIAVVGDSENTAKYAGIRVPNVYVRTMALSGGICGFAGFLAVSGVSHTLSESTADGRGFTAIIIAWLAHTNPLLMLLFSALYCFMELAGTQMASAYSQFKINDYYAQILTGIVLFFILGCEFFCNYKVTFKAAKKGE